VLASVPPSPSPHCALLQFKKDARQQKVRRRHQGKAAECDERDITPDLLLKHQDIILETYVRKTDETLKTCI
jgi:hypothetical protein